MEQYCEMCGNETSFLGTLGNMHHFNCKYCGWHQNVLTYNNEYEKEETCSE
jgi:hypothetical protein